MNILDFAVGFVSGLMSFFSPCILPVLPLYFGILSNSSIRKLKDGQYDNKLLILNTLSFAIGISITFFILGVSINVLRSFLRDYSNYILLVGGVIVIVMGLFYADIIKSKLLSRDTRNVAKVEEANILSSFILGFTFSFGWTPCIGAVLSSVLLKASTSKTVIDSYLLIGIYTIGFILPFLLLSMFYTKLYEKVDGLKKHMSTIKKIGGLIIILMGVGMLINGYKGLEEQNRIESLISEEQSVSDNSGTEIDFELKDQYGKVHNLSDYKGKTIFLNFWATWCPPCKEEMPYIEELYKEYGENKEDVVIIGVASPNMGNEGGVENVKEFINSNGYTFPTAMDEGGSIGYQLGISALPTTFILNKEGKVVQYVPGAMDKDTMKSLIEDAR